MDTVLVLGILATTLIVLAVVLKLACSYTGATPFILVTGIGSFFMLGASVAKLAGFIDWEGLIVCCVIYLVAVLPGVLGSIISTRFMLWYAFGPVRNGKYPEPLLDDGSYSADDSRNLPSYMQEN